MPWGEYFALRRLPIISQKSFSISLRIMKTIWCGVVNWRRALKNKEKTNESGVDKNGNTSGDLQLLYDLCVVWAFEKTFIQAADDRGTGQLGDRIF